MIDYVGRRPTGIYSDMQLADQAWGTAHDLAQRQWQDQEIRARYDEANRYNREGAISDREFNNNPENMGNFDTMDSQLAGLHPQGATPVSIGPASGGGLSTGDTAPATPAAPTTQGTPTSNGFDWSRHANLNNGLNPIPAPARVMNRHGQTYPREVYGRYANEFNRVIRGETQGTGRLGRALDDMVAAGIITQQQANADLTRVSRIVNSGGDTQALPGRLRINAYEPGGATPASAATTSATPTAEAATPTAGLDTPDTAASEATPTASAAGVTPANDYLGSNDTSRALQPTREMRMLQMTVRDSLRRADIAAQHGDRAGAQAAMTAAMQGQAAVVGQYRQQLYRAASQGSLDAMGTLYAELSGQPAGTVRIAPTDQRQTQFVLQIKQGNNWVNAWETPHTREEVLSGLLDTIDSAGAAARTEIASQNYRAALDSGTKLRVATIEQQTALRRMLMDQLIAHDGNRQKAQEAAGRAQFQVDANGGGVYAAYPVTDANGEVSVRFEHFNMQNLPTADTEGHKTASVPVAQQVVGMPGARR